MHRYQPNIHVVVHADGNGRQCRTFSFPNTSFMAVTAYQNHRVMGQIQTFNNIVIQFGGTKWNLKGLN